jgi:hypothetical protein
MAAQLKVLKAILMPAQGLDAANPYEPETVDDPPSTTIPGPVM